MIFCCLDDQLKMILHVDVADVFFSHSFPLCPLLQSAPPLIQIDSTLADIDLTLPPTSPPSDVLMEPPADITDEPLSEPIISETEKKEAEVWCRVQRNPL